MTTRDFPARDHAGIAREWRGVADPTLPATTANPQPNRQTSPDANTVRWQWDVDLTAQQATAFDDLVAAAKSGLDVALYTGIKADLVLVRAYLNIANPTAAQTANALKAHIRISRAQLRD